MLTLGCCVATVVAVAQEHLSATEEDFDVRFTQLNKAFAQTPEDVEVLYNLSQFYFNNANPMRNLPLAMEYIMHGEKRLIWMIENDDMRLTWGSWEEGSRRNELNCYGSYFDHVTSEELCVRLGKEIDRLWRETGHKELATSVRNVRREYRDMWLDLYYMCL